MVGNESNKIVFHAARKYRMADRVGFPANREKGKYFMNIYDKILEDGSKVISIFVKDTKSKKPLDTNKVEKNKYYNSRYNYYYKQYKSNKIDELTFNRIKKALKRIRKECSNLKEFSDRFIAFEKEELKKG